MIKISTAECFTYGKIGLELHALAQGYTGSFAPKFLDSSSLFKDVSVVCSLFIPTISAVKSILDISNPPEPKYLIKDIKVYDEEGDINVSQLMACAVKAKTGSDIGVGTTAGIGRGGISVVGEDFLVSSIGSHFADLSNINSEDLYKRQISGINKGLEIISLILSEDFKTLKSLDNIIFMDL